MPKCASLRAAHLRGPPQQTRWKVQSVSGPTQRQLRLPLPSAFSFSPSIVISLVLTSSRFLSVSFSPNLCIVLSLPLCVFSFFPCRTCTTEPRLFPCRTCNHGATYLPLSNVQPRSHVSSLVERAPLEPPFAPVSQPEHTALPRTDFSRQRRTAAACPHTHTHLFSSHGVLIQQTPPCSTKPYTHTLYPHVCMHTHNMNFSLRRRNTTAQLQLKFVFHTHSMHTNTP